jgi:rod shape-determining protein MreD
VSPVRAILAACCLGVAWLVETTVLTRIGVPGATPDLVLLTVLGFALACGPLTGAVLGFSAGLTLDLVPPADTTVGQWALVLCLAGYLAGQAREAAERSIFVPLLVVALSAAATVLLYAGMGALFGDPRIRWVGVAQLLPTAVLYDLVLTPLVVFAAARLPGAPDTWPGRR